MPDGALEILGRIDSQIKLRGVRIEAEGISNVLRQAAVKASNGLKTEYASVTIVATHPNFGGANEQLVAFIACGGDKQSSTSHRKSGSVPWVLQPSRDPSSSFSANIMAQIKDASKRELASYMRPSHILPIAYIPLNPNGKTDAKALHFLFASTDTSTLLKIQRGEDNNHLVTDGPGNDDKDGAGESETFKGLASILNEILPGQIMTLKTNLFETGLDSFGFGALARLITKKILPLGSKPIRTAELMTSPELGHVVAAIDSRRPSESSIEKHSAPEDASMPQTLAFDKKWRAHAEGIFDPGDIESVLPPLPVQEGVLFRTLQQPGHYVQHFSYHCASVIDMERLKAAWRGLMRETQILR